MKTLEVKLEYKDSSKESNAREKLENLLEDSNFKLIALKENADGKSSARTDSSFDKMHSSLPDQPEKGDPDVSSAGAGGMVSPDSGAYPNRKKQ
ncbi:hypothetical protein [Bacillus sp. AK031]